MAFVQLSGQFDDLQPVRRMSRHLVQLAVHAVGFAAGLGSDSQIMACAGGVVLEPFIAVAERAVVENDALRRNHLHPLRAIPAFDHRPQHDFYPLGMEIVDDFNQLFVSGRDLEITIHACAVVGVLHDRDDQADPRDAELRDAVRLLFRLVGGKIPVPSVIAECNPLEHIHLPRRLFLFAQKNKIKPIPIILWIL